MKWKFFSVEKKKRKEGRREVLQERQDGFAENAGSSDRLTVAVVAACSGAGASFVCGQMLQHGLPDGGTPEGRRSLAEMGKPYFYNALNMDRRREALPPSMPDWYWFLQKPGEVYDTVHLLSAAKNMPGNLILLDCSGLEAGGFLEQILGFSDRVYLVLDPLPARLLESRAFILYLQALRPDLRILVNKFNRGVHGGELSCFLGTGNYLVQEMLPPERVYRAEYRCTLP